MMNIVLEASESASGDFGILMLRSAEAGGVRGIAGQLASAATAGELPLLALFPLLLYLLPVLLLYLYHKFLLKLLLIQLT